MLDIAGRSTELQCPICGAGRVTAHVDDLETEYKGAKVTMPSHYLLCGACGSDFAGANEMRANKRAMLNKELLT